jgi:Ser/Thr protein kinase RdoA (MazF antagonist)
VRPSSDEALLSRLAARLAAELDFHLARVEPIDPGRPHNNRLSHLWSQDGREAVLKIYYRDDRHRLDREYSALHFLNSRGMAEVPLALLRDDHLGCAVYSFEHGTCRFGPELTSEHVEAIAAFAAALHHIHPDTPGAEFRTGVAATFSLADQVAAIRRRLGWFTDFARSAEAFTSVRALCTEIDVQTSIERLIDLVLLDATDTVVPREAWSLTMGDLAPHNILVRDDGSIRVLDFEYSGWDDPVISSGDFLASDSCQDLAPECTAAYVRAFRELATLSSEEIARSRRVAALMEISWSVVHLSLVVPERFAVKQFADPAFDLDAHLAHQLACFRRRLARAEHVVPEILAR